MSKYPPLQCSIGWISVLNVEPPATAVLHRLDICTTGVLILATSGDCASRLTRAIADSRSRKVYLARVVGAFPRSGGSGEGGVGGGISNDEAAAAHAKPSVVVCEEDVDGKSARTSFECLSGCYLSEVDPTAVVTCRNGTSRVPLQF